MHRSSGSPSSSVLRPPVAPQVGEALAFPHPAAQPVCLCLCKLMVMPHLQAVKYTHDLSRKYLVSHCLPQCLHSEICILVPSGCLPSR